MNKELIRSFLEAYAVGDAYGKATEYCTRHEIEERFDKIDTILPPEASLSHQDLDYGQITDDTGQNIYLIREYARRHRVNATDTAECLLKWFEETDAERYIGPNSLKALKAIKAGEDAGTAGKYGTTCGGLMRTPAAFFFSTPATLEMNIVECLKPTHFTSIALESAMAYAYALQAAADSTDMDAILDEACKGACIGRAYGNRERMCGVAPYVDSRIRFMEKIIPTMTQESEIKTFLYDIMGATLASYDVSSCIFALFIYAKDNVNLAIKLATEMGGDTDTIACLTAGLCTLYAKRHNIDQKLIDIVSTANNIDFAKLAELVTKEKNR